ncbi:MAG: hypothetical protein EOO39_39805 [Cytophagaceae bacterium]|nr:MAG: hypothetical protein EOO39_39805 [Cytophagaceae bacterium]
MPNELATGPVMAVGEDDLWIYDIDVHPKPVAEFTVTATIVSVEQGKPRVFIEDLYLDDSL